MTFASPYYFFALIPLVIYICWYCVVGYKKHSALVYSDIVAFRKLPRSMRQRLIHLPFMLWVAAYALAVVALARPQSRTAWSERETEGIDIMLAMDVSTSMLAEDLRPNRLEAAKEVALNFIADRPNDNIGLTVFAGEAFTQCPLTTDHTSLLNLLQAVKSDIAYNGLIEDGTAIGMGIANAINRLKTSKTKSKVIILLTDGSNNRGDISPMTATEIAKSLGIRIYTIGVGTNGTAPYPMQVGGTLQYVNMPVEIDQKTLAQIAAATDANFYRATNNKELAEIYSAIDKLEKSKLSVSSFSKLHERYQLFAALAALCLLLQLLLGMTIFKHLP